MTELEWVEKGYGQFIAEAFEDLGMTEERLILMTLEEILDAVLSWHGIQGYTSTILDAIERLRRRGKV